MFEKRLNVMFLISAIHTIAQLSGELLENDL